MESRAACLRSSVAGRVCMRTPSLHVNGWLRQGPGRAVAVAAAQEAGEQAAPGGTKPRKEQRRSLQQSSLERRKARVSRVQEASRDRLTSDSSSNGNGGALKHRHVAGPVHDIGGSSSSSRGSQQPSPSASQAAGGSSSSKNSTPSVADVVAAAGPAAPQSIQQRAREIDTLVPGQQQEQEQQQQQQQTSRAAASESSSSSSRASATSTAAAVAAAGPSGARQQPAAAAAARRGPRRIKEYAPVVKGDMTLPGGPHWSSLRRHISPSGADPSLPSLPHLIIVEGDQDQRAVARAVNAPVYVCDGTRVLRDHVRPELDALPRLGRTLVVLTDPDERGRELRNFLDEALGPGTLHAFIPEKDATSAADTASHEAGNRGIEHVVPRGVQLALQAARGSFPADRREFTAAELQERGLANAWNASSSGSGSGSSAAEAGESEGGPEGPALRRRRLCALLGLGRCQGSQLLDMLNRYVTRERFEEALAELQGGAGAGPAASPAASGAAAGVQ